MKCSEFENRIYLYDELTSSEKALLDSHRNDCNGCSQLADQYFQSQAFIKKASVIKQEAPSPHHLRQRIMDSIAKEKHVSVQEILSTFLDNLFVRFAFSAASLLLVGFFLYELQSIDRVGPLNQVTKTEIKSGPVLDMELFLYTYRKQRTNKEPIPISRYAYYKSVRSVKTYNQ